MNEYICCLMGICCAFGSPEQFDTLVALRMKHHARVTKDSAEDAVRFDIEMAKTFRDTMKSHKD